MTQKYIYFKIFIYYISLLKICGIHGALFGSRKWISEALTCPKAHNLCAVRDVPAGQRNRSWAHGSAVISLSCEMKSEPLGHPSACVYRTCLNQNTTPAWQYIKNALATLKRSWQHTNRNAYQLLPTNHNITHIFLRKCKKKHSYCGTVVYPACFVDGLI